MVLASADEMGEGIGNERKESANWGPEVDVPCKRMRVCLWGVPGAGWIIYGAGCSGCVVRGKDISGQDSGLDIWVLY